MKASLIISASVHAAILAVATIAFPSTKAFEIEPMKALPVDIVDASELTRLKAGKKDAKPEEAKAKPEKPVEVAKPAEEPKKEPPKKVAALPPEPPKTPEAPKAATPAPTPPELRPKAEPKPEPKPEPKKAEPVPAPKEEPQTLVNTDPVPVPDLKPPRKPAPKKQVAQKPQTERKFDADRIAALLNKVPDQTASTPPPTEFLAKAEAALGDSRGQDATMSISEIDALRQQIAQCWNPPIGVQGAAELAVRLNIALNPDGSVAAEPQLASSGSGVAFLAAADSARRAVLRCQPYQLPPEKYDAWREISVNFDPREMLGG